jgi:hypothetical protein
VTLRGLTRRAWLSVRWVTGPRSGSCQITAARARVRPRSTRPFSISSPRTTVSWKSRISASCATADSVSTSLFRQGTLAELAGRPAWVSVRTPQADQLLAALAGSGVDRPQIQRTGPASA